VSVGFEPVHDNFFNVHDSAAAVLLLLLIFATAAQFNHCCHNQLLAIVLWRVSVLFHRTRLRFGAVKRPLSFASSCTSSHVEFELPLKLKKASLMLNLGVIFVFSDSTHVPAFSHPLLPPSLVALHQLLKVSFIPVQI
jgi:hypothetical protein